MTARAATFGGVAGTTLFEFLRPSQLLTLLPAAGVFFGISVVISALSFALRLPLALSLPVSTLAIAPLVGRLTLAAKGGDRLARLTSVVSWQAMKGFTLRYAVLNALWEIPSVLLAWWALGSVASNAMRAPGSLGSAASPLAAAGVVLLLVVGVAVSVTVHLVAARTETLAGCFAPEPWLWVRGRLSDLPILYAALLGGFTLLSLLVLPPFFLLAGLLARASPAAGMAIAGLGLVLWWASTPVLLCRLLGAFARDIEGEPAMVEPEAEPDSVTEQSPVVPPEGVDVPNALAAVVGRAKQDPRGALADAEALNQKAPGDKAVLFQLTRLYAGANRLPEAVGTGAQTISLALAQQDGPLAAEAFALLRQQKKGLRLGAEEWERLARALLAAEDYADGAWCFVAAGSAGADQRRWLKGLVGAGDSALKAGRPEIADRIYQHVVATAPQSPSAEYCRGARARLQPKLKARSS